jgi:hypothetical protein
VWELTIKSMLGKLTGRTISARSPSDLAREWPTGPDPATARC